MAAALQACSSVVALPDGTPVVESRTELGLRIYYPPFSSIDLRCGTMPSTSEQDVLFCAEAAFTEALLDDFSHSNIDGNHVCSGVWYEGAPCPETATKVGCTGGFVWYGGRWEFVYGLDKAEEALLRAADGGGMGFLQEFVLHEGARVPNTRAEAHDKLHYYRVLAEFGGRLCVIDGTATMLFTEFISRLCELGVSEALYLDMGSGWNHSWYRDPSGRAHIIHPWIPKSRYCTNWITFYK